MVTKELFLNQPDAQMHHAAEAADLSDEKSFAATLKKFKQQVEAEQHTSSNWEVIRDSFYWDLYNKFFQRIRLIVAKSFLYYAKHNPSKKKLGYADMVSMQDDFWATLREDKISKEVADYYLWVLEKINNQEITEGHFSGFGVSQQLGKFTNLIKDLFLGA